MTALAFEYHVKRSGSGLILQSKGRTPRGRRFIIQTIPLASTKFGDAGFKGEVTTEVNNLFVGTIAPPP